MFNFKNKKYKFTGETLCFGNTILHRIVSLKNFNDVSKGQLGGFIESEDNLSHDGDCWVYYHAKVKDNARITGNAEIKGDAYIFDNAQVAGNVIVTDNAVVYENACLTRNATINNNARVYGSATVSGRAIIGDDAIVRGKSSVYDNAIVCEKSIIDEHAHVCGESVIYGTSNIKGTVLLEKFESYKNADISKTSDYFICDAINYEIGETLFYKSSNNKIRVVYRTDNKRTAHDVSLDTFMKTVNEKCVNSDNINSYNILLDLVKSIIKTEGDNPNV